MEKIESYLNTALVNLCGVSVSGPPVVPMGRAIEAVSLALTEAQRLRAEQERAKAEQEDDNASA